MSTSINQISPTSCGLRLRQGKILTSNSPFHLVALPCLLSKRQLLTIQHQVKSIYKQICWLCISYKYLRLDYLFNILANDYIPKSWAFISLSYYSTLNIIAQLALCLSHKERGFLPEVLKIKLSDIESG